MATVGSAHAACTNVSNFNSILFPAQTSSADGFAVGGSVDYNGDLERGAGHHHRIRRTFC